MKKVLSIILAIIVILGIVGYAVAQHRGGHGGGHGGGHHGGYGAHGGGCFISTSVYGADHEATEIFRNFRDKFLTGNFGKELLTFYYENGKSSAKFLDENPSLKPVMKIVLLPLVGLCHIINNL